MTKLLLSRGASPNDNESLYHSVESPDLTCARLLLEHGAKVDGTNALCRVLDFDRLDGLQLLLDHSGSPDHPGYRTFPLFHAIRRGRSARFIRELLARGADRNLVNNEGMTPYRFALLYGKPEIADLLKPDGEPPRLSAEELFVGACARGDSGAAKKILAGDPQLISRLGHMLLFLPEMAQQSNAAGVKAMVEAGWPIDVTGADWNASALNIAVFRGDVPIVEFLLEHGARWDSRHGYNDNVMGTLSFVSRQDSESPRQADWLACAKLLIAHGMPVPPKDYDYSDEIEDYFAELRETPGAVTPGP